MIKSQLTVRKNDAYGAGHFGAKRGNRTHQGEDYAADEDAIILSPVNGFVTKLGYPYADDLNFRYVQVTSKNNLNYRFFYLNPLVKMGQAINIDTPLGTIQDLKKRYPKDLNHYTSITNHLHFEITNEAGRHVDPTRYV